MCTASSRSMFPTGRHQGRTDAPLCSARVKRWCARHGINSSARSDVGEELLRDEDLHSWFLDPDIENDPARPGWLRNSEPLLVNLVDTWALRPEATTAIPNLFLASDYVRTLYRPRDDGGSQ